MATSILTGTKISGSLASSASFGDLRVASEMGGVAITTDNFGLTIASTEGWYPLTVQSPYETAARFLSTDGTANIEIGDNSSTQNYNRIQVVGDVMELIAANSKRVELSSGNIVFNQDSDDVNFRIESNNDQHMLSIDGGKDKIAIGSDIFGDDKMLVAGNLGVTGSLHVSGNITTSGSIIAKEFRTEFVNQIIATSSGSTQFGDDNADAHRFTGSLNVTGSNVLVSNNTFFSGEDADGDDINLLGIHSNNNCYVGPSSNAWAGGAILYGAASTTNAHVWYEGNAERMRIADNGFLGIGTTSPGYKLDVAGDYRFKDTASGGALLGYHHNDSDNGLLLVAYGSTYSGGSTLSVGANGTAYDHTHNVGIDAGASSFIALGVGGSEKMRVHTDGSVGIGTTSPAHILDVVGTAGLSTGTAWTNTSDKRIKTNVENIENGLDKILKLRPVSFNYTEDYLKANPELSGSQRYNSFIAQEYEEVFPDAVTSEKELVVDGKVIYDDLKQFTPHDLNMYLVKAIQEMKCEIDELKLKIGE